MGAAASIIFTCFGAAYGTAKSGVGICAMGVMRPELIMKCAVPVIMVTIMALLRLSLRSLSFTVLAAAQAGIIAIYGLVVSVLIAGGCTLFSSLWLRDGPQCSRFSIWLLQWPRK